MDEKIHTATVLQIFGIKFKLATGKRKRVKSADKRKGLTKGTFICYWTC